MCLQKTYLFRVPYKEFVAYVLNAYKPRLVRIQQENPEPQEQRPSKPEVSELKNP